MQICEDLMSFRIFLQRENPWTEHYKPPNLAGKGRGGRGRRGGADEGLTGARIVMERHSDGRGRRRQRA
jgi:hypothetical protein